MYSEHSNLTIDKTILKICRNKYPEFLYKANVMAIGLGYKRINGVVTEEKCLQVFVDRKVPSCCLNSLDLIPSYYENIKTDVIECGDIFKSLSLNSKNYSSNASNNISSILTPSLTGTLGCLVNDGIFNYILSNNHIIAGMNKFSIGTPVIYSDIEYSDNSINIIATLSKFINIKFLTPKNIYENSVDAAIALVKDTSITTSIDSYINFPSEISKPILNETLQITGNQSQYTLGKINSIGATVKISFSKEKIAIFKNQIISDNNVADGDSGALAINFQNKAIGFLFAGSKSFSILNPIKSVLDALNVSLGIC